MYRCDLSVNHFSKLKDRTDRQFQILFYMSMLTFVNSKNILLRPFRYLMIPELAPGGEPWTRREIFLARLLERIKGPS